MANVTINEIMFNPVDCKDTDCEWIELHNTANISYNLSSCTIMGKGLPETIIDPDEYVIVTRKKQIFLKGSAF